MGRNKHFVRVCKYCGKKISNIKSPYKHYCCIECKQSYKRKIGREIIGVDGIEVTKVIQHPVLQVLFEDCDLIRNLMLRKGDVVKLSAKVLKRSPLMPNPNVQKALPKKEDNGNWDKINAIIDTEACNRMESMIHDIRRELKEEIVGDMRELIFEEVKAQKGGKKRCLNLQNIAK